MTIRYDPQADALYLRLREATIVESDEQQPGVIVDLDEDGQIVGIEILSLSTRISSQPLAGLLAA